MKTALRLLCCLPLAFPTLAAHAAPPDGPKIFIAPDDGFETDITAGILKKHVPAVVVTDEAGAQYKLTATPLQVHKESTGGKVVRCLFAYCAGIEDSGTVSVQLIDVHTKSIVWAYNVSKQRGSWNRQSMAEAIAKHLQNDFLKKREQ